MALETVQWFNGKNVQTRITTHKGIRVTEKAFKDGSYTRKIKLFKNHDKNCPCQKEEWYTKEVLNR